MKPKYQQIARYLPLAIFVAASVPFAAQAAILADDAAGNSAPTAADNGANTIRANGGTSATPTVLIGSTVSLTGDLLETEVLEITAAGYSVTVNGSLAGTNHDGINSTFAFNLLGNTGVIRGQGVGRQGIDTLGGATSLTNSGTGIISGTDDAIRFTSIGGTVINSGLIDGITGVGSDGIQGLTTVTVTNNSGGIIRGVDQGIDVTTGLTLTNNLGASIVGLANEGVFATSGATISNIGTITGATDGVRVGDLFSITNVGTITGGTNGLNLFTVTTGGVSNLQGGLITGSQFGVLGGAGVETITNAGTITGSLAALQLNGGANVINLNDGSVISGNIFASGGTNTITFNGGKTSATDLTSNVVNGNVSNTTLITKAGAGLAQINGNVTADTIAVNGGALYINGNVSNIALAQNTINVNGGALGGTGFWNSVVSLVAAGGISPGAAPISTASPITDAVGSLTVTGNVSLDATSFYRWDINPTSGAYDQIILTGANVFSTNNSEFRISPTDLNDSIQSGSRIVVDTAAVLSGNFGSITLSAPTANTPDTGPFIGDHASNAIIAANFSTLTKVNGGQDWQLTIARDYSQFGGNPNQVAAGEMLNGLFPTATGNLADLFAALDYSSAGVTVDLLSVLDPASYLSTGTAILSNNYRLHRTVETHNAAIRSETGTTTSSSSGSYSSKGGSTGSSSVSYSGNVNLWGSAAYDWQTLNSEDGSLDSDGDTGSFTAGVDFTVANNFRLGLVAEGSRSTWDSESSDGTDVDSYRFGAYANWGETTGWFVDALVGYNTHNIDQDRTSSIAAGAGTLGADYDADGWQGMITIGHAFDVTAGLLSPFVGVEWQRLNVDGFTESNAVLPLTVSDYDVDSLRGLAGVKWEMDVGDGAAFYATAAYAHEFEDDTNDVTVSFAGSSFTANGLEQNDSVLLSAGVRWAASQSTTVDVGYRGEVSLDDDGLDSHGANIGLNYAF